MYLSNKFKRLFGRNLWSFEGEDSRLSTFNIKYVDIDLLLEVARYGQRGQQTVAVLTLAPLDGAPGRTSEWILFPFPKSPDNNAQLDLLGSEDLLNEGSITVEEIEESVGHDVKLPSLMLPRHKNGAQGE